MHTMHSLEDDAEREGDFRYRLPDLFEAADHVTDEELKEAAFATCEDLRKGCVEYLEYTLRFMEYANDPDMDHARRLCHNGIVSNLTIITRILGGDFRKWYSDPAMHGGLNGEKVLEKGERIRRPRTEAWAAHEALMFLKIQLAIEEEEYGNQRPEGSSSYAA